MTGKDFRGAIGGKTGKTAVLPGFCKIERGGGGAGLILIFNLAFN